MLDKNSGADYLWTLLLTIGGIFGLINIRRAFNRPDESRFEEYERIISEKDKIIETLEKRIITYQTILKNDNVKGSGHKLE